MQGAIHRVPLGGGVSLGAQCDTQVVVRLLEIRVYRSLAEMKRCNRQAVFDRPLESCRGLF